MQLVSALWNPSRWITPVQEKIHGNQNKPRSHIIQTYRPRLTAVFISSTTGHTVYLTCNPKPPGVLYEIHKISEFDGGAVYRCIFRPLHFLTNSWFRKSFYLAIVVFYAQAYVMNILSCLDGDRRTGLKQTFRKKYEIMTTVVYGTVLSSWNITYLHMPRPNILKKKTKTKHFICETHNIAVFLWFNFLLRIFFPLS